MHVCAVRASGRTNPAVDEFEKIKNHFHANDTLLLLPTTTSCESIRGGRRTSSKHSSAKVCGINRRGFAKMNVRAIHASESVLGQIVVCVPADLQAYTTAVE